VLGVDEVELWPRAARAALKTGPDREIISVYPSHSATPAAVWQRLITDAVREIMLCGTSPYWLWYEVPNLTQTLRGRVEAGARVRVVIGIADDPMITADEVATGSPMTLSARIAQTRHVLEPLRDMVQVRQSGMGYGRSVYRGDDQAVVHLWLHGQRGEDFPTMHLHKRQAGGIFDQMVRHTEALWADAAPVWP